MATRTPKLCPLAQHIVKLLAESPRGGHGPSYAAGKAEDLNGMATAEVLAWAWTRLDAKNQDALAQLISDATGESIEAVDLVAAGMLASALRKLPPLNVRELLQ